MKNTIISYLCLGSILLININRVFAQTVQHDSKHTPSGWTTNNPFHTDVFVENKGQFNNWAESKLPIIYAVNNADKIFFTKQGVVFKLVKLDSLSEEEREHQEHDKDKDKNEEEKIFYVSMNWEGCNPNAELKVSEASEGYYTFGEKGYENVKAKGYKKLLYKDIYPNIDVEYTIPAKGGIKYKIILHPNADPSLIKMHYTGDLEEIKTDKAGNIIIETLAGDIIDHTPESYYESTKQTINSSFKINNNTVSFQLQTSNSTLQTLIIDPWTTTPTTMFDNNVALDIGYDIYGNVFFSGGVGPYKLSKYTSTGNFLWTFTNLNDWALSQGYFYSKFCVIKSTGTSFIGEGYHNQFAGCRIMKINSSGTLDYISPHMGMNNEIWSMFYNNCSKQLIAFGGGTVAYANMRIIADTNLTSCISQSFNGITCFHNDVASSIMDNKGDFYALVTNMMSCYQVEGHLQKSLYSTNYSPPCIFDVQTSYLFNENNPLQGIAGSVYTVRANALALNSSYVFSYDGMTLKAWNKVSGSLLDSIIVDNSYSGGYMRTHEGIDADECNNVYIGGTNKVHLYTFTGTAFTTLALITTNITGEVHDIKLNRANGNLYVCGVGFVTETIAPISCIISPYFNTLITTDSCKGNVYVKVTGGTPPYSYQWSNGSTDSCITGVPTGVYIVTVTDNSCVLNNHIDTINISYKNCEDTLVIPNIFTPNGDGFNDYFFIKNAQDWNINVQVFNRWGNEVCKADNYQNNWDGKYNGKPLSDGVYYYIINAKGKYSGREAQYHGSLTILR